MRGRGAAIILGVMLIATGSALVPEADAAKPRRPPPPPPAPVVAIYGDSLIADAVQFIDFFFGYSGYTVEHHEFAGAALCDYFSSYSHERPAVTHVVMAFTGNAFSACMQGRDWLTAYREDATRAAQIYVFEGKRVI